MGTCNKMICQFLVFYRIAYRSLIIHKFRSFLSVLGIVCGVMAVMAMISTGEGAKQEVLGRIEKMGLTNIYIKKVSLSDEVRKQVEEKKSYGLSLYDVEQLKHLTPAILQVGAVQKALLTPVGTGIDLTPGIMRCTGNYDRLLGLKTKEGRFINEQDSYNNNQVCVIGSSLARRMGREGRVGSLIRMNDSLFKIVGVLTDYDSDMSDTTKVNIENFNDIIFLPLNIHDNRTRYGATVAQYSILSTIVVEVDNRKNVESVAKLINRTLELSHNRVLDYNIIVPLELLAQSLAAQRIFNLVLAVTGGVSLLVGGIGIMNIMLATVTERKKEIGIRRAVGATKRDIACQFLAEAVLLTMSGGLIGLVGGGICISIIEIWAGWPIKVTVWAMILPFILACGTGIFFGLYPAVRAAKMDPILALRTV